jgi:uncharacterized coiled-coil protein SlyX
MSVVIRLSMLLLFVLSASLRAEENEKPAAAKTFAAADLEFFESKVRPILVKRCYECHSAEKADPQGGLRLDSHAALLKGGDTGKAVVPGDPKKSLLIDTINYGELYQMPPKNKLPPEEIAILTTWVEKGTPWTPETEKSAADSKKFDLAARKQAHWCWQPVSDPTIPAVQSPEWCRDPLDRFVLAKLEQQKITPAGNAERHALVRRAAYDVTGMLPDATKPPEFLRTGTPADWERYVDELLASPRFGEHWARHWLDLARYAETYGHEFDYTIPQASRYRDYVIRAFNADVPYDQFAREQIAGDLLEKPRVDPATGLNESIVGTGFWYFGEQTHAPVDVRVHEADRIDNMLDVFSKTFLGVTVACARCHDHKFDAISTRDYYALSGVLRSTREQVAYLDPHESHRRAAAELEQHIAITRQATLQLWSKLPADAATQLSKELEVVVALGAKPTPEAIQKAATEQNVSVERLQAWLAAIRDPETRSSEHPGWFARQALEGKNGLQLWTELAAKNQTEDKRQPTPDGKDLQARTVLQKIRERDLRISWFASGPAFTDQSVLAGEHSLGEPNAPLLRPDTIDSRRIHPALRGVIRSKTFLIPESGELHYRIAGKNARVRVIVDGYRMDTFNALIFKGLAFDVKNEAWHWHHQRGDLKKYVGQRAHLELIDDGDGWIAFDEVRDMAPNDQGFNRGLEDLFLLTYDRDQLKTPNGWAKRYLKAFNSTISAAREKRLAGPRWELFAWLYKHQLIPSEATVIAELQENLQQNSAQVQQLVEKLPPLQQALAAADGDSWNDPVYVRGNPKTLGETVPRQMLTALAAKEPMPFAEGHCGRLELAEQVTDVKNPLFSRVIVNRLWHHLFGRGIVATVDNFGVLGQQPTHPELLDRLATDFQRDNYSIKRMLRRIMLSRTYQSSAASNPPGDERDPANDLLHKQRMKRVTGEALRDMLLQLSGKLDPKMYGPSVPVHLTPFMQGRGRPGESGPLDGAGRRSIYLAVRRNFLSPLEMAFDKPMPTSAIGRRNVSNVPAQALILLNDPFVRQQCERWAERMLADKTLTTEQRLARMGELAWNRTPTDEELKSLRTLLQTQAATLGVPEAQAETNAPLWADVAQVLVNSKEFLFVP